VCEIIERKQMKQAVLYLRVSTARRGQSGLGLDAQRKSVHDYISGKDIVLLEEYTEVESGKNSKRPVLQKALEKCKSEKAILLIAKLDRLGRNVAFISKLMESNVDFIAVDNPYASKLVVHIMAAFAEFERDQISQRTKEALQAAKRRGVILGRNGRVLAEQYRKESLDFARKMKPVIERLKSEGHQTIRALTVTLNRRRIATFTGRGKWHKNTVFRLLKQIKNL
jgi:DNA invertase Pin-like site-specific DNA recombinase